MTNIVLIDDEVRILNSLHRMLRLRGWNITTYSSPQKALEALAGSDVDVVISDYRMPDMDGAEVLKHVRSLCPDAMRIIMSGQADMEGVLKAINEAEIYRFITKPWTDAEFIMVIESALQFRALKKENEELAAIVRAQRSQLEKQAQELQRLENDSPGITSVKWCEDGSIDFSEYLEDDNDKG